MGKGLGKNQRLKNRTKQKTIAGLLKQFKFSGRIPDFINAVCEQVVPINGRIPIPNGLLKTYNVASPLMAEVKDGHLIGITQ